MSTTASGRASSPRPGAEAAERRTAKELRSTAKGVSPAAIAASMVRATISSTAATTSPPRDRVPSLARISSRGAKSMTAVEVSIGTWSPTISGSALRNSLCDP